MTMKAPRNGTGNTGRRRPRKRARWTPQESPRQPGFIVSQLDEDETVEDCTFVRNIHDKRAMNALRRSVADEGYTITAIVRLSIQADRMKLVEAVREFLRQTGLSPDLYDVMGECFLNGRASKTRRQRRE